MKKTIIFTCILLIALTAMGGWIAQILGRENQREIHNLSVSSLATQLDHIIQQRLEMAERLASDSIIINHLKEQHEPSSSRHLFNTANAVANTDLIYIINEEGTTVASSDSPRSPLIGRNYSFRPYFKESIKGQTSIFPAVGVFTGQRGLHLSVPIYSPGKAKPMGVLVLKIGISEVENILHNQEEKVALISPEGIVFSTNQPHWLLNATQPISTDILERLKETKQFGDYKFEPIDFTLKNRFTHIEGTRYRVATASTMIPDWKVISFQNASISKPLPSLYKILIVSSLCVTGSLALLIFSLIGSIQRQKKTETKRIRAEKKYRSIFENAVMGIYQSSIDGVFVEASPSMAKILGYGNPQELIDDVRDIEANLYASSNDREAWINLLNENGQFNDFQTRFRRKDGEIIWVSLSCRLTQSPDGKDQLIEGFCLDITENVLAQKEAEIQHAQLIHADKMVSIGVLTAGIAHEINNPNTYIISSSEILSEAWEQMSHILAKYHEEQQEDFLIAGMPYSTFKENVPALCERIINGSRRIHRIIKELLDFSRKDANNFTETVDINKVLNSTETLLSSTIKKNSNNFSIQLDPSCPTIKSNFLLIEQVVINIIQNACQSLENPDKSVCVKTCYQKEKEQVVISCTDEGIGIPQSKLSQITEPFYTTKRNISGSGLGLAISSSIMHDLGATMEFESEEGIGTTVYLRFPVSKS